MRIELKKYNAHVEYPYHGSWDEVLYIDERNIQVITFDDESIPFSDGITKILLRIILQENTTITINFLNVKDAGNEVEIESRTRLLNDISKEMNKKYIGVRYEQYV